MKKRRIFKAMLLISCLGVCVASGLAFTGCRGADDNGISFVEEVEKKGPQFLEGSLANVEVGATIVLTEYIEYVTDSQYTVTITDEAGTVTDLTNQIIWVAEQPGVYTITYTVKSGKWKGTNTFTLTASYPELTWQFSLQGMPYNYGDTLIFDDYFSDMNIYASLENWEVKMDKVDVGDKEVDLTGEDSYTFQSMDDHTFHFHIESSDGQTCEGREVISIKYIDSAYMQELQDMNISTYGELYVEEGNYTMVAGSYCNGNNVWLRRENGPHNVPYLAYNGDYGIGDFVKVDFTGLNMPTLSFFRDEYSKSMFDGTKGIVYTGGFTDNNGNAVHPQLNNRCTLYGPYMMHEYDRGADDTTTIADAKSSPDGAYPGSFNSLDANTRYRMIAGFTGIEKGRVGLLNSNPTEYVDALFLTFRCVILNLDTKEIFSDFSMRTYGIQALRFLEIPLDTEDNEFFKGNIVLYGQHGRQTKFDAIYPIITDMSFEEIYEAEISKAEFKETAKSFVLLNSEINVSDYIDTTQEGYSFFYRDEAGVDYPITGETFTITQEGRYTFFYKYGEFYYDTLEVFVGDLKYMTTMDEDGKIVLGAGSIGNGANYVGPNANNLIDQAYIAFTGEYGLNDYVALDFTGKNMPEIAFFADNFDNSMYAGKGGKEGVVVASGVTLWDGSASSSLGNNGNNVCVSGPYMANFNAAEKDQSGNLMNSFASKLAREKLEDGVHYRVIIGFTEAQDPRAIVLKYALYNLDTNELVEEMSQTTWNMFSNPDFYEQDRSTLCGSIILYGKFRTTTVIDKFWGIYEDTTIGAVKSAIDAE